MKLRVNDENKDAESRIPPAAPDGSEIGVNYADLYIKAFNVELADGRAVSCKRRGLKVTLTVGDLKGEALMRKREHGPDVKVILRQALCEAAQSFGAAFSVEEGVMYLDLPNEDRGQSSGTS